MTAIDATGVIALTAAQLPDYLEFFDHVAFTDNPQWAGCYCYFPHHDPAQGQWQSRSGAENRSAMCNCIGAGTTQGYLAYRAGKVVGWCNAGPWTLYPMLTGTPAAGPGLAIAENHLDQVRLTTRNGTHQRSNSLANTLASAGV